MALRKSRKVIKLSRRRGIGNLTPDRSKVVIAVIVAAIIGLLLVFMPNAYKVSINGEFIGAVKDKRVIEGAKDTVITQLQGIYNAEVKFEQELQIEHYRARKKDYIDQNYLVSTIRNKMEILIAFKEIFVEGTSIGIVASEEEVSTLKAELKKKYYGNREVQVEFDKKVEVKDIFAKEKDLISMDRLVQKCIATTPKAITYTVQVGDSLSSIADHYNITMDSIVAANEGFTKNSILQLGQEIKANINEPLLPLKVISEVKENNASVEENKEDKGK